MQAKIVVTKKLKTHDSVFSPSCRDAPTGAIGLYSGSTPYSMGHIADVITHAKFCDNQFMGFGVLNL